MVTTSWLLDHFLVYVYESAYVCVYVCERENHAMSN